jgi:hypothetical protein
VTELEQELVAHAKRALRAKAIYDRELAEVDRLLPLVRAENPKKNKVVVLEGMIGKLRDRGWISRNTAAAIGKSGKPGPVAAQS